MFRFRAIPQSYSRLFDAIVLLVTTVVVVVGASFAAAGASFAAVVASSALNAPLLPRMLKSTLKKSQTVALPQLQMHACAFERMARRVEMVGHRGFRESTEKPRMLRAMLHLL